jgi:hypothetical protein
MAVDPEEFAYAKAVLNALADGHVRRGHQLPRTVVRAREILDRAAIEAMSQSGQPQTDDPSEWIEENMIGAGEVAELLGCDRKSVQRNAEALGGRMIAGRYVFDKTLLGADSG